jgi:hypothetical protein
MHMIKLFLVLSAVFLVGLAQPFPLYLAKASALRSRPVRLVGMNYVPARRISLVMAGSQ